MPCGPENIKTPIVFRIGSQHGTGTPIVFRIGRPKDVKPLSFFIARTRYPIVFHTWRGIVKKNPIVFRMPSPTFKIPGRSVNLNTQAIYGSGHIYIYIYILYMAGSVNRLRIQIDRLKPES